MRENIHRSREVRILAVTRVLGQPVSLSAYTHLLQKIQFRLLVQVLTIRNIVPFGLRIVRTCEFCAVFTFRYPYGK